MESSTDKAYATNGCAADGPVQASGAGAARPAGGAAPEAGDWQALTARLPGVRDWARPLIAELDYAALLVCAQRRGLIPPGQCSQLFGVSRRAVERLGWQPQMKQRLARLALAELTAADALPSAAAQLAGSLFGAALAGPRAADDQGRWMERLSMALGRLGHGLGLRDGAPPADPGAGPGGGTAGTGGSTAAGGGYATTIGGSTLRGGSVATGGGNAALNGSSVARDGSRTAAPRGTPAWPAPPRAAGPAELAALAEELRSLAAELEAERTGQAQEEEGKAEG
jgi:hypothetical protein